MKTNHFPLIVGIALPIIFIVIIAIVIFTPSLFVKPGHNFIYTTEATDVYSYYQSYKNTYFVENNKIISKPTPIPAKEYEGYGYKGEFPTLYMYDVVTNTSHEVTASDITNLNLDPGPSSPDGYTVAYDYSHEGIFELFGSNGNNSGYFISKGNGKKKLDGLLGNSYGGRDSFRLIGWIK